MDTLSLTKNGKIYSGEKTASSVNGAGKSGQPCVKKKKKKNEIRALLNTIHKNKLKMD